MGEDLNQAATWVIANQDTTSFKPTAAQLVLLRAIRDRRGLPPILRLTAAPGCGKTAFCLMLLHGLCRTEANAGLRLLHYMTANTKALVTELVAVARQIFPDDWLAPVGVLPDGSDRFWMHQQEMARKVFEKELAAFDTQEADVKAKLADIKHDRQGNVVQDDNYSAAFKALRDLHLARFDFYTGDEMADLFKHHESKVRLALCTTTYKLKHTAGERGPLRRLLHMDDVLPGGHVCDEADMVAFGALAAAIVPDRWLLAPNDPAQHMRAVNERSIGRGQVSREQNPNDWLAFSDAMRLTESRRFGKRVVGLLTAMFPNSYENLTSHPSAPDTKVVLYDCNYVHWKQAIPRAGGVADPLFYARVGAVVERACAQGEPVMLVVVYATMRELLKAYLQDNFGLSVAQGRPEDSEESTLWVASARQSRGGTRPRVIACLVRRFAWDQDYEGHSLDLGKINVCVSRATRELIIFTENWGWRPYDTLHRMVDHIWHHRHEDGYDYRFLQGCDVSRQVDNERQGQAAAWIDDEKWSGYIQHDSDDEDPTAVEFFATTDRLWEETRITRKYQERDDAVPRWQDPRFVPTALWAHVRHLVFCTTVSADEKTDHVQADGKAKETLLEDDADAGKRTLIN